MSLNPQQDTFVIAYAATMNATEAAKAAGYRHPDVAGSKLLATVKVRRAVIKRLEANVKRAGLPTDAELLERLHRVAWADPNELSRVEIHCCRYCHGPGFTYQWRSEEEWAEGCERALKHFESLRKSWLKRTGGDPEREPEPQLTLPSSAGGFDFDALLLPIPECPKCDGRGTREIVLADTRFLTEEGRWLYAGVKVTKEGVEVMKHDQMKMRELELRHRGLLNDKLIHITPGGAGALNVEQKHLAKLSMAAIDGFMAAHDELLQIQAAEKDTIDVEARDVTP